MAVTFLRAIRNIALPDGPIRLPREERIAVLVMTKAIDHREALHVLACRIPFTGCAHARSGRRQVQSHPPQRNRPPSKLKQA